MDALTGPIARVEAQRSHREFVTGVAPARVMMSVVHARRLLKRGETASTYFPAETDVITTTTVADDHLHRLSWEDEWQIVREFEPDAHVPADYDVYGDDPEAKRASHAENCATGTVWMDDRLRDDACGTTLLPLIKGETADQRDFGYRACAAVEADTAAVYATQYFTAGGGGGRAALVDTLESIREETDDALDVVVIGLLSPAYLEHVPSNVVAAAGQRTWRERVTPRSQDTDAMRKVYDDLADDVRRVLDAGEDRPGETTRTVEA